MSEDFIFRLGADVSQFTKSISDVQEELKRWQNSLKTATGSAIVEANANIANLQKSIENLKNVGLDKLPKAAANGAASLSALGQVARDAPFGFIAIQNNLPILFDSFGALTKASGGLKGAFASIGAALSGPAGVTFALGAVVSALTVLSQKYGSIGGAIDAFVGKTITAKDVQDKFNAALEDSKKAAAGEIANLNSLVAILTSVNSSRDQQKGAFDELNKKYPALLKNIKLENVSNAQSISLISSRTKLIKDQILLEGRREALIKLIGESALEGEKALNALTNRDSLSFFEKLGVGLRGLFAGVGGLGEINVLAADLGNAAIASESYAKRLDGVNASLSAVDGELNTIVETAKKQEEALKKQQQAIERTEKSTKKLSAAEKKRLEDNKKALEEFNLQQIEARFKQNAKAFQEWLKVYTQGQREDIFKQFEIKPKLSYLDAIKEKFTNLGKVLSTGIPSVQNLPLLKLQAEVAEGALSDLQKQANLQTAYNLVNDTFFSPIANLFDTFITTGKFAFKEFAKSVLQAISQIVSKIIATGIIALLFTIATGGFGAAAGGITGGLTKVASIIGSSIGFGGGGLGGGNRTRVQEPSFGGVSGGGMQLAGAVNLTLRGSDLVGSINRTNATINRVG